MCEASIFEILNVIEHFLRRFGDDRQPMIMSLTLALSQWERGPGNGHCGNDNRAAGERFEAMIA